MNVENENLIKLIKEVYGEEEFKYIEEDINGEHRLTNESPARLEENEIYILNTLNDEDKIEAIAHEVAHVLLFNRKLICVSIDNSDKLDFFAAMLNNLISHKQLIEVLKYEFNISSNMHLKLQMEGLINRTLENRINNAIDKDELYGIGFQLCDICRTTGETYNIEIEKLIENNEYVKKSVEVAQKYLNDIDSNMNEEDQIKKVLHVFKELGMLELITILDCVNIFIKENIIELVKEELGKFINECQ